MTCFVTVTGVFLRNLPVKNSSHRVPIVCDFVEEGWMLSPVPNTGLSADIFGISSVYSHMLYPVYYILCVHVYD